MIDSADFPNPQAAWDALANGETLLLRGDHALPRGLVFRGKRGVSVIAATQGAVLRKTWGASFSDRATLLVEDCENFRMVGVEVVGATTALPLVSPYAVWNDDCLNVIGCRSAKIERCYLHDCGDALFRGCGPGSTQDASPSGVLGLDYQVRGCRMHNGFQASTTPSGVDGYVFEDNVCTGIMGSVKFSSRNSGAGRLSFQRNTVEGPLDAAGKSLNRQGLLEIHGYARVLVKDNLFRNSQNDAAITLRDTADRVTVPVLWDDVFIDQLTNRFENVRVPVSVYSGLRRLVLGEV